MRSILGKSVLFLSAIVLWLGSVTPARAMTQVIFSRDGQTASISLLGISGDPDPAALYDSLKVPAEDYNGKWAKKVLLPGQDGSSKAFYIACVFSKMIVGSGSCTVVFHADPGRVDVVASEGRARLALHGEEASRFAQNFNVRGDGSIFRSQSGKLNFTFIPGGDLLVEWK